MLFGSKESPTPARPLVEGTMKLRGAITLKKTGGFCTDLEGSLYAEASVQILPGAEITGPVRSEDEVVLHAGCRVRGPLDARAIDLQEGAAYSGMVRIGPDPTEPKS